MNWPSRICRDLPHKADLSNDADKSQTQNRVVRRTAKIVLYGHAWVAPPALLLYVLRRRGLVTGLERDIKIPSRNSPQKRVMSTIISIQQ